MKIILFAIVLFLFQIIESKQQVKIQDDWDTWYVGPNGNDGGPGTYQDPFKTVNRAVGVSIDNDHIVILRGIYYGSSNCGLVINKNLTFETYEDAGNVVLNCYGLNTPGMIVGIGKNVSLNRLTISFAQATGFVVMTQAWAEIVQVNLFQNQGVNGGGIYAAPYSTLIVRNSAILNNDAVSGAGIYVDVYANVTEADAYSTVNSNDATSNGGGVFVNANATFTWITGLMNNNTGIKGGAIYATGPNTNVSLGDLKVTFNLAESIGGGIAFENGVNATLLHVTTQQNTAKIAGGGIFCNQSIVAQEGCVLHLNEPQNLGCTSCVWKDSNKCNCLRCPSSQPKPIF